MPSAPAVPSRVAVGVALVGATGLGVQVLLTRFFSAVLFYHFSFLAISVALLGIGAGGLIVYLFPGWFEGRSADATLARWTAVLGVSLAVTPVLLAQLNYLVPVASMRFALTMSVVCLLALVPQLVIGVITTLALRAYPGRIGTLYAANLAGASCGAALVVPLLWTFPVPLLMVATGAVAGLAAGAFAGPLRTEACLGWSSVAMSLLLIALARGSGLLSLPPVGGNAHAELVADRWNPLSRVSGYAVAEQRSRFALVLYDKAYAPVVRRRAGEAYPDWRALGLGPQSIGYALTGPGRALVIGGGGGRDIYNALSSEQSVDVIELNDDIRRVVDEDMAAISGSPYSQPRVSVTIGDGRSVLAQRDVKYDQIHVSFTDTLSANAASAFALLEANLYTVQAFDEYLGHLTPHGVLNVSRLVNLAGEEALRATVLVLEALRRHGVEHPERNVVVIRGRDFLNYPFGTILARLEPYSDEELATIGRLAMERGEGIASSPNGPYFGPWADLARAPTPLAFCRGYRLDVCPPTDDRPFFFNMVRLRDILPDIVSVRAVDPTFAIAPMRILITLLAVLSAFCVLAFVVPLRFARNPQPHPPVSSLVFFAAIGLGFMLLEVVMIQRLVLFLGFPTYALSVVLAALLLCSGIGSAMSAHATAPRSTLVMALAATVGLILACGLGWPPLLAALMRLPFVARVGVTFALIAPLGVTMGTAMPLGLARIERLHPGSLPFAWAVNGVTSVLASVLAIALSITLGFEATTLLAAACYSMAFAHATWGRWPAETVMPEDAACVAVANSAQAPW
jgi:hypothetical protein